MGTKSQRGVTLPDGGTRASCHPRAAVTGVTLSPGGGSEVGVPLGDRCAPWGWVCPPGVSLSSSFIGVTSSYHGYGILSGLGHLVGGALNLSPVPEPSPAPGDAHVPSASLAGGTFPLMATFRCFSTQNPPKIQLRHSLIKIVPPPSRK